MGLTTYLYRGYNPFTKYHGHPSIVCCIFLFSSEVFSLKATLRTGEVCVFGGKTGKLVESVGKNMFFFQGIS